MFREKSFELGEVSLEGISSEKTVPKSVQHLLHHLWLPPLRDYSAFEKVELPSDCAILEFLTVETE